MIFSDAETAQSELREAMIISLIPFENRVTLYSLKVAAGEFVLNENPPEASLIRVPDGVRLTPDHFAVQITGHSMNKIVQDGQIALFKRYRGGSRNGLMVIAEYFNLQDAEYGSCYTFKEYFSQKAVNEAGWLHENIVLKPKSFDPTYEDIVIEPTSLHERAFSVIGIFECVLA